MRINDLSTFGSKPILLSQFAELLNSNNVTMQGNQVNIPSGLVLLDDKGKIPEDADIQRIFYIDGEFPTENLVKNALYVNSTGESRATDENAKYINISLQVVSDFSTVSDNTLATSKAIKDYVDALPYRPEMKTIAVTKDIVFKKDISIYKIEVAKATTFTFDFSELSKDVCYTFELWVQMNTLVPLTFPSTVQWIDNTAPDMSETCMYCIVIRKMPNTIVTSTITSPTAIMNLAYKYKFTMRA